MLKIWNKGFKLSFMLKLKNKNNKTKTICCDRSEFMTKGEEIDTQNRSKSSITRKLIEF